MAPAFDSKGEGRKTDTRQGRESERIQRVRGRQRGLSNQALDDRVLDEEEIIYRRHRETQAKRAEVLWKVGPEGCDLEGLLQRQTER